MKALLAVLILVSVLTPQVIADEPTRCNPNVTDKLVALTFDDGPHVSYTERILDILEKYNVKATFFIIGENAVQHPETIKLIYDKGHELGNHTYTHVSINKISKEKLIDEIEKTSQVIEEICTFRPRVFRPPFGAYSDQSIATVTSLGYRSVLWSKDSRDWQLPPVEQILRAMEVSSGDILLFHDYNQANSPTPDALEMLIPKLLDKGYKFVTVTELLYCK